MSKPESEKMKMRKCLRNIGRNRGLYHSGKSPEIEHFVGSEILLQHHHWNHEICKPAQMKRKVEFYVETAGNDFERNPCDILRHDQKSNGGTKTVLL